VRLVASRASAPDPEALSRRRAFRCWPHAKDGRFARIETVAIATVILGPARTPPACAVAETSATGASRPRSTCHPLHNLTDSLCAPSQLPTISSQHLGPVEICALRYWPAVASLAPVRVPGVVSGMPLTKVNGEYRTPGGCSAWHGRCFSTARYDGKCSIGYIEFRRGGWYVAKPLLGWILQGWFDGNEDPGCYWNEGTSPDFKKLWGKAESINWETTFYDFEWTATTGLFLPGGNRPAGDWDKPC